MDVADTFTFLKESFFAEIRDLFDEAISKDDFESTEDLLKSEEIVLSRINHPNNVGEIPLSRARSNKMVQLLLDNGARINEPTTPGDIRRTLFLNEIYKDMKCTTLYIACEHRTMSLALLAYHGADERIKTNTGDTPVENAIRHKHPEAPFLQHFRKLMVLVHASEKGKVAVDVQWIRAMQRFFYTPSLTNFITM
jgi:ankyrin repeat protein